MIPTESKAKCLSSVNHSVKAIHHHHHYNLNIGVIDLANLPGMASLLGGTPDISFAYVAFG